MKCCRLLVLFFKIIILSFFIFCFILKITPAYEQGYTASLNDKIEALESFKEPKIVLIGNSNLALGVNSEQIEMALEMPVINMGLHGGLGNAFHEEMAKVNIEKGDIYIICHTNYSDNGNIEDGVLAWTTIENKPKLWQLLRKQDIPTMIDAFPTYLKKCIKRWTEETSNEIPEDQYYRRNSFNSYGDVIPSRENSILNALSVDVAEYCPKINNVCIDRLNDLNKYIKANGAYMVVAGYPIIVKGEPSDEFIQALDAFQIQLNSQLDCPVISNYIDYCYDESYFFDTIYHLTDCGVELRTRQLIADLNSYLTN